MHSWSRSEIQYSSTYYVYVLLSLRSKKIEKEITEMREDYARKKSDMLEKTRLVREFTDVVHWVSSYCVATVYMYLPFSLVQERSGACCRWAQETPWGAERTQERYTCTNVNVSFSGCVLLHKAGCNSTTTEGPVLHPWCSNSRWLVLSILTSCRGASACWVYTGQFRFTGWQSMDNNYMYVYLSLYLQMWSKLKRAASPRQEPWRQHRKSKTDYNILTAIEQEVIIIMLCNICCSVISSKKTLRYQAEEGARLDTENKELQFRLAHLKENHTYVHTANWFTLHA